MWLLPLPGPHHPINPPAFLSQTETFIAKICKHPNKTKPTVLFFGTASQAEEVGHARQNVEQIHYAA
jgi:hypothetical protein